MTTNAPPAPPPIDSKSFSGAFLLCRKNGNGMKRLRQARGDRTRSPRFRHPSRAAAEIEATRLLEKLPNSTFIILQEVGRVRLAGVGDAAR